MSSIRAVYFDVQEVGKRIKSSKKRYTWRISIDGVEHQVQCVASSVSGKRRIYHNGNLIYQGQKMMNQSFQFPFSIGMNMCNILQINSTYELRINNKPFQELNSNGYSKSSYPGYGSGSYSSYSSSYDQDYRNQRSQTYTSSFNKVEGGWGDVQKATSIARRETASGSSKYNQPQSQKYTDNEEPSFASEFSKFDYVGKPSYSNNTSSNKANDFDSFGTFSNFSNNNNNNANTSSTTTTTKTSVPLNSISNPGFSNYPPENKAMYDNYKNTYSTDSENGKNKHLTGYQKTHFDEGSKENQSDFANFSNFNNFATDIKPITKQQVNGDAFSSYPINPQPQEVQKSQPQRQSTQDFFSMDFTGQQQQPQIPNPTESQMQKGNSDFFDGFTPSNNQSSNQPSLNNLEFVSQVQTQKPTPVETPVQNQQTGGSLLNLGLDFTAPVINNQQPSTDMKPNSNPSPSTVTLTNNTSNNVGGNLLDGDSTPTPTTTTTTQEQPKKSKFDLWDSNLVNLDLTEAEFSIKNKQQTNNNNSNYGYNMNYSLNNNLGSGFGNNPSLGYNNNTNSFGNNINNNFNTAPMNFNMNYSNNTGFGGNNFNTNAGMNMNMGGFNAGFGMGNNNMMGGMNGNLGNSFATTNGTMGYQQTGVVGQSTGGFSTPFDF